MEGSEQNVNNNKKVQDGLMDKVAVLIPCYNEEQTITKVVRDVQEALPEAVVYVYNNNSSELIINHQYSQAQNSKLQQT